MRRRATVAGTVTYATYAITSDCQPLLHSL